MVQDEPELEIKRLEDELFEAKTQIAELKASTKTTLTGSQFLTIVLVGRSEEVV